eukprot:GILJ01009399.1.p1 GENE.GILJ01009399.1~~GILJ01009399.1.p1  ORF type:complete len:517 (-),score=70.91 GILJ01009399.1:176-1687(-)
MALVGAIDQGTQSSRFMVFDNRGRVVASHQNEHTQIYEQPGYCEHDPIEILNSVELCISEVAKKLDTKGLAISDLKAIGITNQRETTVVWDKNTGKPLHNAIVWLDQRTMSTVDDLLATDSNKDRFRPICGLPLNTYFSAVKMKWLMDNVPQVKDGIHNGSAVFGTIDSWLIWNLTGGANGGVHVTDVTNASRTMLLNLHTGQWDTDMCNVFGVPKESLPTVRSSAEVYGTISNGPLSNIAIAGCLGDQQAACVGQVCFEQGQAKNTYGTGCFMLMNTGTEVVQSTHGLLTTICYQLGKDQPITYAVEGSVAIAGAAVSWLKNQMGLINSAEELEPLAASVEDTGDLYFVPALTGLFAPRWRSDARGVMVGISQYTTKAHFARAVLESISLSTREVIDAIKKDAHLNLSSLKADGGMSNNNLFLQIQSDILGCDVVRPHVVETTALGAAFAAGLAVGVWSSLDELKQTAEVDRVFSPAMTEEQRVQKYSRWHQAVERSLNWVQ